MGTGRVEVTYKHLAERAAVSTATVSHVMRGTRYVSPEVRERVLSAAEALGYVPNDLASGLRKQATSTVGFITTELTNPFYAEIALSAEVTLEELGYSLMISNTFNDPASELRYIGGMAERRVDGLLLTSVQMHGENWRALERYRLPYVLVNRRFLDFDAPYVGADNAGGMRELVGRLIESGHRRIGFIAGLPHSSAARERYMGYETALSRAGLKAEPELCVGGKYDVASGVEGARRLMSLDGALRPTAIVASNDLAALGVMVWAERNGVRVPEELAVTGFDDIRLASELTDLLPAGLTTVRQPHRQMGRVASEMLSTLMQDGEPRQREDILPCEVVWRDSAGHG